MKCPFLTSPDHVSLIIDCWYDLCIRDRTLIRAGEVVAEKRGVVSIIFSLNGGGLKNKICARGKLEVFC